MYVVQDLAEAPLGRSLTLVESPVAGGTAHRLAALGLRLGSQFSLVSRTSGGGRVVLVAGTRIALGKSLLKQLLAEVTS